MLLLVLATSLDSCSILKSAPPGSAKQVVTRGAQAERPLVALRAPFVDENLSIEPSAETKPAELALTHAQVNWIRGGGIALKAIVSSSVTTYELSNVFARWPGKNSFVRVGSGVFVVQLTAECNMDCARDRAWATVVKELGEQ